MLRLILALLLATWALGGASSGPSRLSSQEASALLLERTEPQYPPLAKMANIQGSVKLEVTVSESGAVSLVTVISGHPLLVTAAVESAKHWRYRPYVVNGKATTFVTNIEIPFSLGISKEQQERDQAASDLYYPLEDRCRAQLDQKRWGEAEAPCQEALDAAVKSGISGLALQGAYENLGYSLLYQKQFDKASVLFAKALEIAQRVLKETDAELGYAYRNVGMAANGLGDVDKAFEFYTKAEKTLELARGHIKDDEMKARYTRALKAVLGYHLTLAKEAGDREEAAAVELKLSRESK